MTDPISLYAGMAKSLEDCPPPDEREARLKMVMAADALRKAADHIDAQDAKIKALVEALVLCRDELDAYSQQEYPSDHPVHERYRQRDYDANPARAALAAARGPK